MRVDAIFAWRPGEYGELPVLRRHERNRIALIVNELRSGQMTRAAELGRAKHHKLTALDRLRHCDLFHRRRTAPSRDLGTEREEFVFVRHDRGSIHRCSAGY